ncbi:putative leucine-rich repeat-containing protein DDB_G0290503 isoform X2 [Biomphalaria glabrata]|nr:putative leucine-rich repeat-containing protein DDB_G0290503 isoform X2 [Biomphalaria glabrata]XP_055875756.1 putative leucine-rich repeat-containing protein DDB_G0290503 isoform X2 [Biomphalaria glabrata]
MVDKIESTLTKHSRKIKNLQEKSLQQETRIESTLEKIQENETQNDSKFEEFISELQGASQFMSSLQTQNTTLSNKVREHDEQIREMVNTTETLRHLPQALQNQKERLESFVQANESEGKGHVLKMDEVMQEHTSNIQQLNTKYEHLFHLLQTNETKISQLKTCNDTETLSNINHKLKEHEEHLKRIGRNHKEMSDTNRKKMDVINAKIQAGSKTTSNLQVNFESLQSELNHLKEDFKHTNSLMELFKTNMTEIKDQLCAYKSDSEVLTLDASKELHVVKNKMTTVESQMRPAKQVKAVRGQLEVLEDLKVQIDGLLGNICHVIQVGESWIGESDNKTFTDIYQFLAFQTAECISKCSSIANGSEDACQSADTTEPSVKENTPVTVSSFTLQGDRELSKLMLRFESIENSVTSNSKKIKILNQRLKEQERNQNESTLKAQEEMDKTNAKKYEQIIEELHAASSFMSNLQKETESLSQNINERVITASQQEQKESNTVFEVNEMKLEISKTTESLCNLSSLYDALSSQVNENNSKISELCSSVEKITLNNQGKSAQIMEENRKDREEKTRNQTDDTEDTLQSTIDLFLEQVEWKSTTNQLQELHSFCQAFRSTSSDSSKNEVSDSSVLATTLMTTMDEQEISFKDYYEEKINRLSEKIAEMNECVSFHVEVESDRTLNLRAAKNFTCFNDVITNDGKHFDVDTGTFSVPCSGLYLFSLKLDIDNDEEMEFNIYVKSKNEEEHNCHYIYVIEENESTGSVVFPLNLSKEDEVYIRPYEDYLHVKVRFLSYFSCVLIKNFQN